MNLLHSRKGVTENSYHSTTKNTNGLTFARRFKFVEHFIEIVVKNGTIKNVCLGIDSFRISITILSFQTNFNMFPYNISKF